MDEHIPSKSNFKKKLFRIIFRFVCHYFSDQIIGVSKHTLKKFTQNKVSLRKKSKILYYGIHGDKFLKAKSISNQLKEKFNLRANSKLILFLGRLAPAKNPLFFLKLIRELQSIDGNIVGIIVGEGDLKPDLENFIQRYECENYIKLLGWQENVAEIMKSSDLFVSPHVHYPLEGLGLVILESQLSQTPMLISKGISKDPILKNTSYRRLSLNEPMINWIRAAQYLINTKNNCNSEIDKIFYKSDFDMKNSLSNLITIHET